MVSWASISNPFFNLQQWCVINHNWCIFMLLSLQLIILQLHFMFILLKIQLLRLLTLFLMEEITIILGHRSLKKTIIMNTKLWFLDGTKIMLLHPLLKSLVYSGAATFAWNDLKSCFSRVDRVWVESLQHEMLTFRQNSPYVYDYFTKLKWFWKELETFVPIQNCTCNAWCQCDAKCVFLGYTNKEWKVLSNWT